VVSQKNIEQFFRDRGFSDYFETSAQTGDGCIELRDAIMII
jgi:hypothetical protein